MWQLVISRQCNCPSDYKHIIIAILCKFVRLQKNLLNKMPNQYNIGNGGLSCQPSCGYSQHLHYVQLYIWILDQKILLIMIFRPFIPIKQHLESRPQTINCIMNNIVLINLLQVASICLNLFQYSFNILKVGGIYTS